MHNLVNFSILRGNRFLRIGFAQSVLRHIAWGLYFSIAETSIWVVFYLMLVRFEEPGKES